ncbi:perilipin-1 [Conger conger]|uniref:perilipin-1 n=1 Tax=Conger conger TaxID=82655 RepID=UPI002A599F55|nr:perilipin-1 [Conger conger]XP_061077883.1 perilipin-1 [Conger conger]
MAPEKTTHPRIKDRRLPDSVFVRLLNLPVVSSTCEMMERTYTNTKRTHPLLCSVFEVYEKGARTAGSLVVWSVKPAVHRLEPQIEAVNSLACSGLDRLEEKIPALQYSPEKLASGIAEVVTSAVQSARQGVSSTSGVALSLATGGYQRSRSRVSDGVSYVMSSGPVRLATEGADVALSLTEHLVNYVLPASDEEIEADAPWEDTAGESPASQPGYRRLGALVSAVCHRAYSQTAAQLHHAGSQGRELVMSVPGVAPLTGVATRNLEMAGGVVLGLRSTVGGLLVGRDQQTNKEARKKKEGELLKSGRLQGLLGGLGRQLQSAYVSVVSAVKNAPTTTLGLARGGTGALLETLSSARQHVLETTTRYGLLPGLSPEGGVNGACTTIKEEEEEEEENKAPRPSETSQRGQKPEPLANPRFFSEPSHGRESAA